MAALHLIAEALGRLRNRSSVPQPDLGLWGLRLLEPASKVGSIGAALRAARLALPVTPANSVTAIVAAPVVGFAAVHGLIAVFLAV
jgi:hypothetical protein